MLNGVSLGFIKIQFQVVGFNTLIIFFFLLKKSVCEYNLYFALML